MRVLVMAAEPRPRFIASLRRSVQPLVHAPQTVQSARIGGIAMVEGAVLQHERAETRPVARVGGGIGSACGGELSNGLRDLCRVHRVSAAPVVVFDRSFALLLLREPDVEVAV